MSKGSKRYPQAHQDGFRASQPPRMHVLAFVVRARPPLRACASTGAAQYKACWAYRLPFVTKEWSAGKSD